jgi:hypothetical protein
MLHKQSEQDERNTLAKGTVKRELVEVHHEWMCSQCGHPFYNPGCVRRRTSRRTLRPPPLKLSIALISP